MPPLLHQAQFDDITVIPEEGRINPVGTYHGKDYTGFDALQPGIPGVITLDGVAPETPPNQAVAGIMAGVVSAIAIAEGTKSFALSSFYYGCATQTDQGLIELATACNITVTGYGSTAAGAKPVVSQVFDFKPVSVQPTLSCPSTITVPPFDLQESSFAKRWIRTEC